MMNEQAYQDECIDYENTVLTLLEVQSSIWAVSIIDSQNRIAYSTDNWEISADVENVVSSWEAMNAPFIMISGVKYTILESSIDCLVATSLQGQGHIVGVKDDQTKLILYVIPEGDIKAAIVEASRILRLLCPKTPYMETNEPINVDSQLIGDVKEFLDWIKDKQGLAAYIKYYLDQNHILITSKLAKIFQELVGICQL